MADDKAHVFAGITVPQSVFRNFVREGSAPTPPPQPSPLIGFKFPEIPEGAQTTLILVPFPVTTTGPPQTRVLMEEGELLLFFLLAMIVWAIPILCINKIRPSNGCARCCRRCFSRHLACYFLVATVLNLLVIAFLIAIEPDISANDLFFALVKLVGDLTDNLENVLTQLMGVGSVLVVFLYRHRIVALLGYDHQLVRADLRDILTCFTMSRFNVVELSILRIEGLPSTGFTTRTLYARIVSGFNEPQHSRPHDGCTTSCAMKEQVQFNYDPEDNTQKLSIVIKQQEVVSQAVSHMAPVVGALVGGGGGLMTPLGPGPGAVAGAVAGIGAANSLGKEIARVDLSSVQVNRLRDMTRQAVDGERFASGRSVPWREEHFTKIDLVPKGTMWVRIQDLDMGSA